MIRPALTRATRQTASLSRSFRTFAPTFIKAGDSVPSVAVHEGSPGNEVNLAEETANGKYVIIGVPGAFSPACSASHAPGYIKNLDALKSKGVSQVFVVAVNDAFVTKAWSEALDAPSDVRFIADASGEFSKKFDTLLADAAKFFGNARTKRYAAIVENGKVTKEFVEPDNFGLEVSVAENILKQL